MKWIFLLLMLLLMGLSLPAQHLQVLTPQLDYGIVFETERDSLPLVLDNPFPFPVTVTEVKTFPIYGEFPVTLSRDTLILAANGRDSLWVACQPQHNIFHNQELLVYTDLPRGALAVDLRAQGRYSNVYYASTENLSEQALKNALSTRISQGYQQLSYSTARDEMFMFLDNQKVNGQGASVNTLECVYTGALVTNYPNRTDAQLQGFNTEHTFPQGFFNQDLPMRSDIFHLFPTDASANSERGNSPFGVVNNPSWQQGGSKSNGNRFEPRDAQKGPVARAMTYFVLRYQDYQNFYAGQEAILRTWHQQFPPTAAERARNDGIFAVQNNRNPFIDYPQFWDRISSISGNSVAPAQFAQFLPEASIDFDTVTGPVDYHFPVVNTGNQNLVYPLPVLSDGRLSVVNAGDYPITVPPGEALPLIIRLQPTGNSPLAATLSLSRTDAGAATETIPVQAAWSVLNGQADPWPSAWQLIPQSQGWELTTSHAGPWQWQLLNLAGQTVARGSAWQPAATLDLRGKPSGLYILQVQVGGRHWARQLSWSDR